MLKKIFFSGLALVPIGLARLGFNAVLLRVYGEETSGALNLALSLGMALALPVSAAFGPSVLRFVSFARGQGREDVAGGLLARLLGAALAFEVLVGAAAYLGRAHLPGAARLDDPALVGAIAVGLSYSAYLVLRNGLYALDRVRLYAMLELGAALVFFAGLVGLVRLGPPPATLLAFLAGYASFCVAALIAMKGSLRLDLPEGAPSTQAVLRFSGLAALGTTASMGLREAATVLTPSFAGLEGTAFVALCIAALAPMHFVPRTLRALLFAESATQHGRGDGAAIARRFSEISHQLALLDIPIVGAVLILARPLLELSGLGIDDERVLVFRLLALAGLLDILGSTAVNALAGMGRVGVNASGAIIGLAAAIVVWLAVPDLGLLGVAVGYLAASLVRAVIPVVVAASSHGVRPTRAWPRVLTLAVAAAASVALADRAGPWLPTALHAGVAAAVLWPSLTQLAARLRGRRHSP